MDTWHSVMQQAVRLRHQLHRQPELSWEEENTSRVIREQLDALDIAWRSCARYGTVATLAPQAKGRHLALRGDIDALPINELADLPYRSQTHGKMHACGHDGHTAALWAAAAWLKHHEAKLPGPVTLLFQPAEEGGHGARSMIEDGALEGVDCIYGWHNWPAIPYGKAVCPDGPVMSGNGTFEIELSGKGGHASQPELCRDPVLAAAAITLNLQQIVSRRLPPQSASVISVTQFEAISAPTVTPERVKIGGSIRLAQPELRATINQLIEEISVDTARSYGVSAQVETVKRYEATINHTSAAADCRQALSEVLGPDWQHDRIHLPIMASEDFSYYLNEVPGAFALIGMAREDNYQAPCHSPHYVFNDDLIPKVVEVFARLCSAPVPE
ncbi:N(2)-acetyl-L-2,4-diaminobutanoate deacetylase DoeB2 [Marinobacterium weihaiense]|uniref:N(2)-acetyl-L-2,4-diaminobutanoate deacetylase DoeB2 n=1 Tax=Marinobacterium weihaiense TaxID=2851016 RepID=A0ABS6MDH6_9GAMM|nr:N(2)-acetyl-L-2,4-diaminobutanoate deacetylase DoeB2 [Marinobacterium weihaiense]MBV0934343.1 N(2)-acetyl-L-2,4-diaminobutanoate deacetylase DoeB2 [Marinobacterium weihaiense]